MILLFYNVEDWDDLMAEVLIEIILVIVKLKDSIESALFHEFEQFKYTFPKECVKIWMYKIKGIN